jgi:hypothetical protein
MKLDGLLYSRLSPLRPIALGLTRRFRIGSFKHRLDLGAFERPEYAYCVYHSASLAKKLGYSEISVLEFGVAGGNGLVAIEQYAAEVSREVGIGIAVYGFDSGRGLPEPVDYRDLPYHWQPGFFDMDEDKLRRRLRTARLVIGDIRETAQQFFDAYNPAPVAAVLHDMDFYSSTVAALSMFDVDEKYRIPRVYCYFDDIVGEEIELYNDFTGERLAIAEFNGSHATKKLSPAYHLITLKEREQWFHQIFLLHDFEHSRYNQFVSDSDQQLPLV